MSFRQNHLLGIETLAPDEIVTILDLADRYAELERGDNKHGDALKGLTQINMFFEASTRTQASFELAGKRLGADVMNMAMAASSLKKGETLIDTALTLNAMHPDLLVVRHPHSGAVNLLAEKVNCAVLTAGDGKHEHPTQALLDAFSMRERLGDLGGKKVLIVGDILHSRVALSNIFLLQKLGAKVTVCGPQTLMPKYITSLGVEVEHNLDRALVNADVANMLRIQNERLDQSYFPSTREYVMQYGLTDERLSRLDRVPLIMHPGPINRGVEITSSIADSEHAIILDQVSNGVAIRMAVMYLLAGKQ